MDIAIFDIGLWLHYGYRDSCGNGMNMVIFTFFVANTPKSLLTYKPMASWFAVGDYKKRANMVGGKETASPKEVEGAVGKLLDNYLSRNDISIEDIISFHAEFESIHPFQDGNGRVGRLIAFKECLKHSIVPFIIEDSKKDYYYRGLSNWNGEKGYLIDTCLDGQDTVNALLQVFEIDGQ